VPPRFADELCLDDHWGRIARESTVQKIKESADRCVFRLNHATGIFYVKQHVRSGWIARVKDALLGDPARREFEAGRFAYARDVPAIVVVAHCTRALPGGRRAAATISSAEQDAAGFAQAWTNTLQNAASNQAHRPALELIGALAQVTAKAHNAAFLHPDNHPGNILVRRSAAHAPECIYVDLYGARVGRLVTEADAARNLATLDQWFRGRATRGLRWRFLREYTALRRNWRTRAALRRFARLIDAAARRHARRLYAQRDRRIGRRNAFFDRQIAEDGACVLTTRRFRRLPELLDVPTPDAPTGQGPNAPTGPAPADIGETHYAQRWTEELAWWVGGSPAWRRFRGACTLMNRDIPTVIPLACRWTRRRLGIGQCAWRALRPADSATLREWMDAATGCDRSRLLVSAGRLIAETLARGAVVRNPSPLRIEVSGMLGGAVRVYWSGVEVSTVAVPAPAHARNWMLAQLAQSVAADPGVSHTDRARVLRACCRRLGLFGDRHGWKVVWRAIAADMVA